MVDIQIYDTTLRDGAQQEGISFSVADKLKIAKRLDQLGVHYIEGGWPGSNPKDAQFFAKARNLSLSNSVLCAFGSTRRPNSKADDDASLVALVEAGTSMITIVGKSSDAQVKHVLGVSLDENLKMIMESVRYLKLNGLKVIYDAEHFFDGFKSDAPYAISTLHTAVQAGVDCVVLCDTNGGSLPNEVEHAVRVVVKAIGVPVGVHMHNDSDVAVANSLVAVRAGAVHVQGTINGYGERCGNANLCSIIPNLQLKMGLSCITSEQLAGLTEASHYISEIANVIPVGNQPYTGDSAFTHKAGLHVSGLNKCEESYQHMVPELVGNQNAILVSELSGLSNIVSKAKERGFDLSGETDTARNVLEQVKLLESHGFQYEGAEASFELLIHRIQPDYYPPFELVDFLVVVEKRRRPPTIGVFPDVGSGVSYEEVMSEATVKVRVGDCLIHTAAEGNGPVNALDRALRKGLIEFYPELAKLQLVDYKVRILEGSAGTESQVRVLIESSDGEHEWKTVGSSVNIIEASWLALADSMEFWLARNGIGRSSCMMGGAQAVSYPSMCE